MKSAWPWIVGAVGLLAALVSVAVVGPFIRGVLAGLPARVAEAVAEDDEPPMKMTIEEMCRHWQENALRIEEAFAGHRVTISGRVNRVHSAADGSPYLTLGEFPSPISERIAFVLADESAYGRVEKGQPLALTGRLRVRRQEIVTYLIIEQCRVTVAPDRR